MINRLEFHQPRRSPLPMSTGIRILPSQYAAICSRPQTPKFFPERLLIKEAAHWQLDAIRVEGRAGALVKGLSGSLFAPDAPGRFPGCGEIEIPPGGDLIVQVTYTGPLRLGSPFEACVFGSEDPPLPAAETSRRGVGKKIASVRSERAVCVAQSTKLSTAPTKLAAWPLRLVIEGASDWVVNDICVGETSIFAQSGDVPGSMFSEEVESTVCLGHLSIGDTFTVFATYVGGSSSTELVYELYGTFDEAEAANLPIAAILPMSSGVNVPPTMSARITSRCQLPGSRNRGIGPRQGFLAERIVVDDAADWVFNDITIGRASQFAQPGDVPGLAFGPGTLGGKVSFDVARAWIDVTSVVTYIGAREGGSPYYCGILGSIIDLTESDPVHRRGRILSGRDLR